MHGLQRWQQGYKLRELLQEWGNLHRCLAREIDGFAAAHHEFKLSTLREVHDHLIDFISEGVDHSAGRYACLQQAEAIGHMRDLKRALAQVSEIEERRAKLIHQAVHDLRGDVQSVSTNADLLRDINMSDCDRREFAQLLQQGVGAVSAMLNELLELARLEAGQEKREIAPFDGAQVLRELCATTQPTATARDLYLESAGPPTLAVEGDALKVRRLVQNLLLNSLRYTKRGGVTVSWDGDDHHWWIIVKDTGPGLLAGPSAPIASILKEATASARESEEREAEKSGIPSQVLPLAPGSEKTAPPAKSPPEGEGIGLSIVKRLCELLGASLELASSTSSGTTFRLLFPLRYPDA